MRIVDLEKELIYDTDVLVMGTDGLWDVSSNERVAEVVARCLEQFPGEDTSRQRYRFTSAAQDLVMSSRGKLIERSWRTTPDNKSATIDDISVFVIPLAPYKEEYLRWKQDREPLDNKEPGDVKETTSNEITSPTLSPSGYVSFPCSESEQVMLEDNQQNLQDLVLDDSSSNNQQADLPSVDSINKQNIDSVNTSPTEADPSLEAVSLPVLIPDTADSSTSLAWVYSFIFYLLFL